MRALLIALALLAPLPLLAAAGGALADRLGRELGRSAAALGAQLGSSEPSTPALVVVLPEQQAEPLTLATSGAPVGRTKLRARRDAPAAARAKGVFVRAETVLGIANRGGRPSGAFVSAAGERPSGIALVGVSGLGVGLVDGDILTHAAGRPARSAADVVGVVIGSRVKRARQISGRFWRSGQYYDLVVEQPYVSAPPAARGRDDEPASVALNR
jgi:hypothetical protein